MSYSIEFYRDALKYLQKLDKQTRIRISKSLNALQENPFHSELDIKRMTGTKDEYRLRVGSYRVIYSVQDDILMIYVIKIGPRRDVYNN